MQMCNFLCNYYDVIGVSIMGSYFGFGSPQQQVDMHARSKNTFIIL